jgi:hypothetical protein
MMTNQIGANTMTTSTQTRGHCQMCGRQQAVRNGIAAHGYTVANGWFQGVCQGHRYAPLEKHRGATDRMIAEILEHAAALRVKADETLAGKHDPVEYENGRCRNIDGKFVPVMAPFAEASEYRQQDIRTKLAWNMTMRAKAGEDFCKMMGALADKVHGTALVVVAKPVPAERIQAGDKRVNNNGTVLTALRQDGQRLYYTFTRESGAVLKAYTSPRAWRMMQSA